MKTLVVFAVSLATFMLSCNQTSKREVKENLKEAKEELNHAIAYEDEAMKADKAAEWMHFKNESDSSMLKMENDLMKLQGSIKKLNIEDNKNLNVAYNKAKNQIIALRKKLNDKNMAFDNDMKTFNNNDDSKAIEELNLFKREFKHDMDEIDKSVKSLIQETIVFAPEPIMTP